MIAREWANRVNDMKARLEATGNIPLIEQVWEDGYPVLYVDSVSRHGVQISKVSL